MRSSPIKDGVGVSGGAFLDLAVRLEFGVAGSGGRLNLSTLLPSESVAGFADLALLDLIGEGSVSVRDLLAEVTGGLWTMPLEVLATREAEWRADLRSGILLHNIDLSQRESSTIGRLKAA